MMVAQNQVGEIEQGLPGAAIADPRARIASDPVVLGETGAQEGNAEALRRPARRGNCRP